MTVYHDSNKLLALLASTDFAFVHCLSLHAHDGTKVQFCTKYKLTKNHWKSVSVKFYMKLNLYVASHKICIYFSSVDGTSYDNKISSVFSVLHCNTHTDWV